MNDDFVVELWGMLKPLITSKDRQAAADVLVSVCDEYGFADGLEHATDLDRTLAAAVAAHFGVSDNIDEEY